MTDRQSRSPQPAPRLYLAVPWLDNADTLARVLDECTDAADIAAVLLHLHEGDERRLIDYVEAIAPLIQQKGVALILNGYADLVAQSGADGAHLAGIEAFTAALPVLKPARIAGSGGLRTRDDAMTAGERGADYVMFGDPAGGRPPFDAIVDRVSWWAELFEVPCVAYAESIDEVAPLADAGADFIALGAFAFTDPSQAPAVVRVAAERLAAADVVK
jgi:thiamine-phosphate pyrophosphorylase